MNGSVSLLIARSHFFNSIKPEDRPLPFSWFCGKTYYRIGRPMLPDLCQLLVYPLSQEEEVDNMFQLCNERMIKKYHGAEVIYSHDSLDERGVYHSGIVFNHITIPPIFNAGLLFEEPRLMAKRNFEGVIADTKLRWNKITPNDLFENCFDGYSLVRLYGLQQLKVKINDYYWLDLNPKEIEYLSLAGLRYFPFSISPTRLDFVRFSVKWEQPSDMKDIDDEVDLSRPSMKYFFFNQNARSKAAILEGESREKAPITTAIVDFYKSKVIIIQRWWINIYYNSHHPVGKRVICGKMRVN